MGQIGKIKIMENEPLAPHTTIKLGGTARYFVIASTSELIIEALAMANRQGLDVHILGGGSNTIFPDQGFNGLVIMIALKGIDITNDGLVTVAAGEIWDDIVIQTIQRNLAGFECMSGIPGLVGATPMQNVGAYGQDVSQTIIGVEALDRQTMLTCSFSKQNCLFKYRSSRFKNQDVGRYIITKVLFQLTPNGRPNITFPQLKEKLLSKIISLAQVREAVLELRTSKSMVVNEQDPNSRSCGSFFVNPVLTSEQIKHLKEKYDPPVFPQDDGVKIPVAWLIEQAGFRKGYRVGKVGISENHLLALVNYGGSTKELLALAKGIQNKVKGLFNIELEREPVVISQ